MWSTTSKPASLRIVCMREITSRAMPSSINCGVSVVSRMTVMPPSVSTLNPGLSMTPISKSSSDSSICAPPVSNVQSLPDLTVSTTFTASSPSEDR